MALVARRDVQTAHHLELARVAQDHVKIVAVADAQERVQMHAQDVLDVLENAKKIAQAVAQTNVLVDVAPDVQVDAQLNVQDAVNGAQDVLDVHHAKTVVWDVQDVLDAAIIVIKLAETNVLMNVVIFVKKVATFSVRNHVVQRALKRVQVLALVSVMVAQVQNIKLLLQKQRVVKIHEC